MNPGTEQDFDRELKRIGTLIAKGLTQLPGAIKVIGLEFIHDNFAKEGFETAPGVYTPWPKRKAIVKTTKKGKIKGRAGRQILIDKGLLRTSWAADSNSDKDSVLFTSHLPYAAVHNDGLKSGRGAGFIMPMRKMIGDSDALTKRISDETDRIISETLNK